MCVDWYTSEVTVKESTMWIHTVRRLEEIWHYNKLLLCTNCRPINHFIITVLLNRWLTLILTPTATHFITSLAFISCIRLPDDSSNFLFHDTIHKWQSILLFSKQHSVWIIPYIFQVWEWQTQPVWSTQSVALKYNLGSLMKSS